MMSRGRRTQTVESSKERGDGARGGVPNREGVPDNREGIPSTGGIPNNRKGVPDNREGIPSTGGIPDNRKGVLDNREGVLNREGVPSREGTHREKTWSKEGAENQDRDNTQTLTR